MGIRRHAVILTLLALALPARASTTLNLGIALPTDASHNWGGDYRSGMTAIDTQFGALAVSTTTLKALIDAGGGGGGGSGTVSVTSPLQGDGSSGSPIVLNQSALSVAAATTTLHSENITASRIDGSTYTVAISLARTENIVSTRIDGSTYTAAINVARTENIAATRIDGSTYTTAISLARTENISASRIDGSTYTTAINLARTENISASRIDGSTYTAAISLARTENIAASRIDGSTYTTAINLRALDSGVVHNTGAEPIDGAKTARSSWTFTADVQSAASTATFNASLTIDFSTRRNQVVVLTGNVTSSVFSNGASMGVYELVVRQDGTGSRTFTWPSNVTWPNNGTAPALTTTANHFDFFLMQYMAADGNWHILSEALNN
jgi:hypothetical protein